jgi:hypothetical protein
MLNRRFWNNAMAKIENEGTARKSRKHSINLAIERGATSNEREWIEIALHGYAALDAIARECAINHPIKAHSIER